MHKLMIALILAALVAVPVRAADMDAKAKALVKLDDDWSKAAGAKDIDRIVSFYADDATVYPPNQPAAVGRDAAKKAWASFLNDPSFSVSWKATHAEVSSNLGYTTGTYEATFKDADGKPVNENGKYVCVWKKQKDGAWKSIYDTWNSDSK